MRHALFPLLLLLCACSSLSSDQRKELAGFQARAKHYWENGSLDQAMGQIEKGLALAPDDYLLGSLKGAILLKTSASALGTDHRRLDEATAVLGAVFEQRAANRHERYLLFDYARALQKQGRRHLGEAVRLHGEAQRSPTPAPLREQAAASDGKAQELLGQAAELLSVLLERGELALLAHYHLLLIAQDRRDDAAFGKHAADYLAQMQKEQTEVGRQIAQARNLAFEQERTRALRALKVEEMEVRALLAEHHYDRQQFADALVMLNRVLEVDPSRSTDYYNRGRVLQALGKAAEAKADFRKFLATTTLPAGNEKITAATLALDQ